jgi:hypothetical protein
MFGLRGMDAAWDEYLEAQDIKEYGPIRWPFIKECTIEAVSRPGMTLRYAQDACVKKAYEQYPDK